MGKFRILSFDGGGLKGLISLGILKRLSEKLGSEKWISEADMYAGTSTGGLIALAFADGKKISEITDFYTRYGPDIFNRQTVRYITSVFCFFHNGYANKALSKALDKMFNDKSIDQLDKKVLIASFDLSKRIGKRDSWAPKIFNNFEGKGQDKNKITEVGLCTTAAPTYFPSFKGYIDGGVCANNPSMCALAQVLDNRLDDKREMDEVYLLSVGTGVNAEAVEKKNVHWGILGWNVKLLKIIMDGSVGIADYQCRQILTEKKYHRIEIDLKDQIDMDDAKKIPEMLSIADSINTNQIEKWAAWIKENWM